MRMRMLYIVAHDSGGWKCCPPFLKAQFVRLHVILKFSRCVVNTMDSINDTIKKYLAVWVTSATVLLLHHSLVTGC